MELWVATSNSGKLSEIKNLLMKVDINLHSISELPVYTSPQETGTTFEANARIKAKSLHALKKDCWVLADDSGLEVEGLNNQPGIHSARYAGPHASDAENTSKLLKMMSLRSATNRKARFCCVLVIIDPEGKEFVIEETLNGEIARIAAGKNGFGYDNVFIPEGQNKTFAEMSPGDKNKISHRAKALRKFRDLL